MIDAILIPASAAGALVIIGVIVVMLLFGYLLGEVARRL